MENGTVGGWELRIEQSDLLVMGWKKATAEQTLGATSSEGPRRARGR
jgi:hypothetical protein